MSRYSDLAAHVASLRARNNALEETVEAGAAKVEAALADINRTIAAARAAGAAARPEHLAVHEEINKKSEKLINDLRADLSAAKVEAAAAVDALRGEARGAVEAVEARLAEALAEKSVRGHGHRLQAHTHAAADIPHRHPGEARLWARVGDLFKIYEPAGPGVFIGSSDGVLAFAWGPDRRTVRVPEQWARNLAGLAPSLPAGWRIEADGGEVTITAPDGEESFAVPLDLADSLRDAERREALGVAALLGTSPKPAEPPRKDTVIENRPDPGADLVGGPREEGEAGEGSPGAPPEPATSPPRKRPGKGSVAEARKRRLEEQLGK